MNFIVIIAARTGSRRLPGKALLPLMSLPVISLLLRRLRTSKLAGALVFATTTLQADDLLAATAANEGVAVFRGSENDVLHRYVEAARPYDARYVVRVTGDCPFLDGNTLDEVLSQCLSFGDFDLATTKPAYPHGIDYEVYSKELLADIDRRELSAEDREHILNYIYRHEASYRIIRLTPPESLRSDDTMFLLDTPKDYRRMTSLVEGVQNIHIAPSELLRRHAKTVQERENHEKERTRTV